MISHSLSKTDVFVEIQIKMCNFRSCRGNVFEKTHFIWSRTAWWDCQSGSRPNTPTESSCTVAADGGSVQIHKPEDAFSCDGFSSPNFFFASSPLVPAIGLPRSEMLQLYTSLLPHPPQSLCDQITLMTNAPQVCRQTSCHRTWPKVVRVDSVPGSESLVKFFLKLVFFWLFFVNITVVYWIVSVYWFSDRPCIRNNTSYCSNNLEGTDSVKNVV